LLVTGKKVGGASTPRWPSGAGALVGETGPDGGWVAWRLAGANNRELGRSAQVYRDVRACRESIIRLHADMATAQTLVAMDYPSGLWRWQLDLAGATVAVSARSHRRERDCRYNLRQFIAATMAADVLAEVQPTHYPIGPRAS
jgi:hypothetical protein